MDASQTFAGFISWGFYSLLTGVIAFFVYSIREDFREATRSLHALALNVAELTVRLESFEKSLDRLDERLKRLENFDGP